MDDCEGRLLDVKFCFLQEEVIGKVGVIVRLRCSVEIVYQCLLRLPRLLFLLCGMSRGPVRSGSSTPLMVTAAVVFGERSLKLGPLKCVHVARADLFDLSLILESLEFCLL